MRSHPTLLPPPTCCLNCVHKLPTTHNVNPISCKSTSPCAQWSRKGACNHISIWLLGFAHIPAAPHVLHSENHSWVRGGRTVYRAKFWVLYPGCRKQQLPGFVLLKLLLHVFPQNVWLSKVFQMTYFCLSLFFVFPRSFEVSFHRFGWKIICGQAPPRHFILSTHIQATTHSSPSQPMTLHSPFPPNYTLHTHPHTHLLYPPPHTHTLHTACQKFLFNCVLDLTCKRGSVGQSEEMIIPRSSVRFRLKQENSNSDGFELHRPSINNTKLLLKVIKAIIIIPKHFSQRNFRTV